MNTAGPADGPNSTTETTPVRPQVAGLARDLGQLRVEFDAFRSTATTDSAVGEVRIRPVCWPTLDPTTAAAEWERLALWIHDVLGPYHRITRGQLPDCWARHPAAVGHLVWLRTLWRDAYHDSRSRALAAAEWHHRWLPNALTDIAAAIPTYWCRPGDHLVSELDVDRRQARRRAELLTHHDQHAPDTTTGPGEHRVPRDQVIDLRYWGPHYELGRATDLAYREAQAATITTG